MATLSAVMRKARRLHRGWGMTRLDACSHEGKPVLLAMYPDKSRSEVPFADEQVLLYWIDARVRYGRGKFYKG